MVQPLTPRSSFISVKKFINGTEYVFLEKSTFGQRQAAPYTINTDYRLILDESEGTIDVKSYPYPDAYDVEDEAVNKARARFVDKIGSSSSFGATMTAELKETWGTVVSGVSDIYLAAKAVRNGNLRQAAGILGFAPPTVRKRITLKKYRVKGGKYRSRTRTAEHWVMPSGTYVLKSLANKWLWFSYGVKPLVSDIHNGMDVLLREAPFQKLVQAHAKVERFRQNLTGWGLLQKYTCSVAVKIRAKISVSNPNLWLANQLGLVNPVQMFNEGIPFSFVIDWFSNLGQIINQMTDFVGLEIAEPITTWKWKFRTSYQNTWYGVPETACSQTGFRRGLTVPDAKLKFSYERFEWQRGANAISLLVGFLPKVWR